MSAEIPKLEPDRLVPADNRGNTKKEDQIQHNRAESHGIGDVKRKIEGLAEQHTPNTQMGGRRRRTRFPELDTWLKQIESIEPSVEELATAEQALDEAIDLALGGRPSQRYT